MVEVNADVAQYPELVNQYPYSDGWLVKIRPTMLRENMKNLFSGNLSESWMSITRARLNAALAPDFPMIYATSQDGGELIDGIANQLRENQVAALDIELFQNP